MGETLSLNISKKNLNKALRMLNTGYKSHKKYAEVYSVAFKVDNQNKVSVLVPGGEYIIDAETSAAGCFALNYKWFKMLVKDCKTKSLDFKVESGLLTVNNTVSVRVKQYDGDIDIPLSLSYSAGEMARLDLSKIEKDVIDFWGLASQIENAREEVEKCIDKAYLQVAKYLSPKLTSSAFKAKLRKELLIKNPDPVE